MLDISFLSGRFREARKTSPKFQQSLIKIAQSHRKFRNHDVILRNIFINLRNMIKNSAIHSNISALYIGIYAISPKIPQPRHNLPQSPLIFQQ